MPTVDELREYLKDIPGHLEVILPSDAEGNNFSEWSGDHSFGTWERLHEDLGYGEFSEYYEDENEEEHPVSEAQANAVAFWPV